MEFKKLQISDLKPASYNPRKELKPGDNQILIEGNCLLEIICKFPVVI